MSLTKIFIIVFILFNCFVTQAQNSKEEFVRKGKHILDLFIANQFDSIASEFNEEQKAYNSAAAIASNYIPTTTTYGNIQSYRLGGFTDNKSQVLVEFVCKTTYSMELLLQLTFVSSSKKLVFFTIKETFKVYAIPAYADAGLYNEENIIFAADSTMPLRGILTLPATTAKAPLVIIIPAAGPTDMDGVFASKPYKDISVGLASNGIAVFRYNKRSLNYGFNIMQYKLNGTQYTPELDVLFDLYAAIDLLKQTPHVDSNKIYLLGHGEGAYLAPYVASKKSIIKGIVMMGANANHPLEMMNDQNAYLIKILPHKKHDFDEIKERSKIVLKHKVKENTSYTILPYDLQASYWLWINEYKQVKVVKKLSIPVFIMQGGRDYQVDKKNFFVWQKKLRKKKNASFKLYPKMNHIMHEGEGESTYSEYSIMRHIPFEVINDLKNWLQNN